MLKHWQTHAEYQQFISEAVASLNTSQLKKLHSISDSWHKLTSMNLDPVGDFLAPFYSNTGRPAINQTQILRSFVLMLDRKFTSLTKWTAELSGDDLLAILIGCSPDSLPPLGSYFDFMNRLWLHNPDFEKSGRGDLFPAGKNKKPSSKPGKNKKLPNRHPGITDKIADYALTERDFLFYYEKALQQLFSIAAISPSVELGLIDPDNLTASVQSPVEKRKSVRAKSPVPLLPMGAAFILNLLGISAFIPQYHEVQRNIKRLIITAQVQSG